MTNETDVRVIAQSIFDNMNTMQPRGALSSSADLPRSHSINLVTDDFIAGYVENGRMSVVRRFFCLFVTFDLIFISLLWIICIMITGQNIYTALKEQVIHYSIYTSLFDIVMAAICRFVVLLMFYAFLYIHHWIIIALSTTGSCVFLISKVFVYDWVDGHEQVFQVVLVITSFVLAWGEAWFLDCRVLPQERHARSYFAAVTSNAPTDRSPLLAPFLSSVGGPPTESIANFYSPYDSVHNSDGEDEQDEEYRQMGIECVRRAYEILESTDWKLEKLTAKGDTIKSTQRNKLGKIYRLTGRLKYPAKPLLEELFYRIEDVPKWNPTLLESKIVRKIDTHTDISYQATTGGPGGIVTSRDFVNLRCWRLCRDGNVIIDSDDEDDDDNNENILSNQSCGEGSVSTTTEDEAWLHGNNDSTDEIKKSISESKIDDKTDKNVSTAFFTLSQSLGAKAFQSSNLDSNEPPPLDEEFLDAKDIATGTTKDIKKQDKVYISAAFSIDYSAVPPNAKYVRGENLVSCWAMREIDGKSDACIFEWLLCLDLKGYIPRYILDTAYTTLMQDYMTYLRKYCNELRKKNRKVPK